MGNLHQGHLALVQAAKQRADKVVVSIFVNPMQFGQSEDYTQYPRTLQNDQMLLAEKQVDVLFAPTVAEIFHKPLAEQAYIILPQLSHILCGEFRPQHFSGVATIVNKLFNIVQPDMAFFGEKDYQQYLIIKTMAQDLNLPIEICAVATQRDYDGLALSSRNQYLTFDERQLAPKLYAILQQLKIKIIQSQFAIWSDLIEQAKVELTNLGFKVQYLSLRCRDTLKEATADDKSLILLIAAYLGSTRLIDNIAI
jgi:pantoate--beta-alanine ligase